MLSYADKTVEGFIKPARFGQWIKAIRGDDKNRDLYLECLWPSQLISKNWLVSKIKETSHWHTAIIFGGWFGTLGNLLLDNNIVNLVVSIDIDPICAELGPRFVNDDRIEFVTADMAKYNWLSDRSFSQPLVINTSTEHVSQNTYDQWLNKVLRYSGQIVLQGTNFEHKTHIRRFDDIKDFEIKNRCIGHGEEIVADNVHRYMAIISPNLQS